jgi:N-ethylmaleimide reductase
MRDFSFADYEPPRELDIEELPGIVEGFRRAVSLGMEAGFDGIELHAANGYLLDQFLEDGANQRTDAYGGNFENRCRLLINVVNAVKETIGADRLGVRLSPLSTASGMHDSNPIALYNFVISALGGHGLAYLHMIEARASGLGRTDVMKTDALNNAATFGHLFQGPILSAGGYTPETAASAIDLKYADAIAFGRLFISNPDLVDRFRIHAALSPYDRTTFYGGGAHGHTHYPALQEMSLSYQ